MNTTDIQKLYDGVVTSVANCKVLMQGSYPSGLEAYLKKSGNEIFTEAAEKTFDAVFSFFELSQLNEEKLNQKINGALQNVKVGGKFIFVEECPRFTNTSNPKKLKLASFYTSFVGSKYHQNPEKKNVSFEIIKQFGLNQNVQDSDEYEKSCWIFEVSEQLASNLDGRKDFATFGEYLDQARYSYTHILRYEQIFGEDFVSTGGINTTKEMVKQLAIKKGEKILDVGCGIGGSAFHFVQNYGAQVEGLDLSSNMIELARKKNQQYKIPDINFYVADATKIELKESSFDIVYSRDTILHIPPKRELFTKFFKWLKPGGRLLITDYCCGPYDQWQDDYQSYIDERGYTMLTVEDYGKLLSDVGFKDVQAVNKTDDFLKILQSEVDLFDPKKEQFIKAFSEKDFVDISEGWKDKLVRCSKGDQRWGMFVARK